MVQDGLGRHIFYLSQNPHTVEQLSEATKLQYIYEVVIIFGTMFIKVSVGFFLLRTFGLGTERWWRWALYSIMAFSVLTSISSAFIVLTQCRPVSTLRNPLIHGSCWGPGVIATGYYNGGESPLPFCHAKRVPQLMLG